MPLTSAAISQQETERKLVEVLNEWLKLWFSNTPRTLAGVANVTLPVVDTFFGQQNVPQPSGKSQIHATWDIRNDPAEFNGDDKLLRSDLTLTLNVRTAQQGVPEGRADAENRRVADGLKQVFESETKDLALKGLRHLEVARGPVVLPSPLCKTRLLIVTGKLVYSQKA